MRFILLITLGFWGCSESISDEIEPTETLIFGTYYGHCFGETCVETFKIENGKLYEDLNDDYSKMSFDFVELSNELYTQVIDIIDHIPQELRDAEGQTFGCPDCADQGGVYIELFDPSNSEANMRYYIDQSQNGSPKFLHNLVEQVNQKIALLQ